MDTNTLVEKTQKNDLPIIKAINPVMGYWLVAYVCILAGNILRVNSYPEILDHLYIGKDQYLFWLLLLPFFANRVILYENDTIDKSIISLAWQLPLVLFILIFLIYIPLQFKTISLGIVFISLVAIMPFYIQSLFITRNASRAISGNGTPNLYMTFKHKVFFPAISTCTIPLLLGWSNYELTSTLMSIVILIIVYWTISFFFEQRLVLIKFTDYTAIAFVVTLLVISFSTPTIHLLGITLNTFMLSIAILTTLVMGILETWWFIKDRHNFNEYLSEFYKSDNDYFLSKTDLATLIIPTVFPLCYLFPAANTLFLFCFVL